MCVTTVGAEATGSDDSFALVLEWKGELEAVVWRDVWWNGILHRNIWLMTMSEVRAVFSLSFACSLLSHTHTCTKVFWLIKFCGYWSGRWDGWKISFPAFIGILVKVHPSWGCCWKVLTASGRNVFRHLKLYFINVHYLTLRQNPTNICMSSSARPDEILKQKYKKIFVNLF